MHGLYDPFSYSTLYMTHVLTPHLALHTTYQGRRAVQALGGAQGVTPLMGMGHRSMPTVVTTDCQRRMTRFCATACRSMPSWAVHSPSSTSYPMPHR